MLDNDVKYAIDKLFSKGLINGWVADDYGNENETYKVRLYSPIKEIASLYPILDRPDVKNAGLHETGKCGFSFDCKKYGVKDGDLIFVIIENEKSHEIKTTSFIYGDSQKHVIEYNAFELPRSDFSIMECDSFQLFEKFSHLIALKALLIRLRRNKRGKGGRGKFVGVDYSHQQSDVSLFMSIIYHFREAIFDNLSTRHLFSLTDTVADFADDNDRLAALSLSMIMFHERFAFSLNLIYDKKEKDSIIFDREIPVWGGMASNRLESDDALDVYLTRAIEVLQLSPVILSFFMEITLRTMSEKKSIFSENILRSPYFSTVWDYYKHQFEMGNKKVLSQLNILDKYPDAPF